MLKEKIKRLEEIIQISKKQDLEEGKQSATLIIHKLKKENSNLEEKIRGRVPAFDARLIQRQSDKLKKLEKDNKLLKNKLKEATKPPARDTDLFGHVKHLTAKLQRQKEKVNELVSSQTELEDLIEAQEDDLDERDRRIKLMEETNNQINSYMMKLKQEAEKGKQKSSETSSQQIMKHFDTSGGTADEIGNNVQEHKSDSEQTNQKILALQKKCSNLG